MKHKSIKLKQVRNTIPIQNLHTDKEFTAFTIVYFAINALLFYHQLILLALSTLLIFLFMKPMLLWVRKRKSDWVKEQDIIGTLLINENYIGEHSTNEITSIHIQFNKQRDEKFQYREPLYNGLMKFDIELEDKTHACYIVLLEEKKQFNKLVEVLKDYYKKGMAIEEQRLQMNPKYPIKTFLFRNDYLYAEKQELKVELQMEKFPI